MLKTWKSLNQLFYCSSLIQWKTLFRLAEKNRNYEMSSFDEKQATTLLKERPIEFVNYNKHQLSRVYPAGTRFDSSNFNPQVSFSRSLLFFVVFVSQIVSTTAAFVCGVKL